MGSWRVTLPCTRAEADALHHDTLVFADLDPPPAIVTSERDPKRPDDWRLEAYFEDRPSEQLVARLRAILPSAQRAKAKIERVGDRDWVTVSQSGLEPLLAGRFFVHTPDHRGAAPAGAVRVEIAAGRAFGTGHHETTIGCLLALDRLKREGTVIRNLADLGTGTGLLAFAALRLWPAARAIASDIDPVAIEVARENAAVNQIAGLELVVAAGLNSRRLARRAPYDLIVSNILAGPLIELAPPIGEALAPGGTLVLAGLLERQAAAVASAYRREGLRTRFSIRRGEWPTLVLRKRRR